MSLCATSHDVIARMRCDLMQGVPVYLQDDTHSLVFAGLETIDIKRFSAFREAFPASQIALTKWRADTLKIRVYHRDIAIVNPLPEHGLRWAQSLADPVFDLASPLKGPFTEAREGPAELFRKAITLCKQTRLLPAVIGGLAHVDRAIEMGLIGISAKEISVQDEKHLSNVVGASVPIQGAEDARLHVFRPDDGSEEHYIFEVGQIDRNAPVLTRLHSACFTGDVLGSLKCDCGPQLRGALAQMGAEGGGLLLYLNQEGRGIGLGNKMRAYALQDQGFDTVEANHRLGFEDDERDFQIGATLLRKMGVAKIRLLTNNPAKCDALAAMGLEICERVPLKVGEGARNRAYLETKARKSGHIL